MTAPLRLVDTGLAGARWNVAMSAALGELHLEGRVQDTLRLHRYERSVLLGRHQKPRDAVDEEACARAGIEVARRVTGGGAVYMAPGVLAWDLVVRRKAAASLDHASATVCGAVARALRGLGFPARFRPPADVVVGRSKVSGSAGRHEGGTLAHQGTVLVDADLAEMTRVLREPARPVVTLARLAAGRGPGIEAVSRAIGEAIAHALGRPLAPAPVGILETERAERLFLEEIGADAFVLGSLAEELSA